MAKKIRLEIPLPCQENWDAMTVSEKGRFCGSCQKTVMDFSNLTDYEIAQFFKKPSTGSICGRFNEEQLQRDIAIPTKRLPWLRYFFQIVLPAFLGTVGAKAQGKISIKDSAKSHVAIPSQPTGFYKSPGDNEKADNLIGQVRSLKVSENIGSQNYEGKVIDESGSAIDGATVMIKGANYGVMTDEKGHFTLKRKDSSAKTLVASSVGYETTEFIVPSDNKAISITLKKQAQYDLRGVVVVTAGIVVTTRTGGRQKKFPILNGPIMDTANRFFNVFPNPVPPGMEMTIEWKDTGEGYYQLQLVSSSGQVLHQREVWIDKGAKWLTLELPSVSKGQYFLQVSNKNTGKTQAEKIIVL
jgi:hypothetical protein